MNPLFPKAFFVTILVVFPSLCSALEGKGGLPGYFLNQGVGVRALGMGRSFVAVTDSSSLYWNAAALSKLKRKEITAAHIILFEGTRHDFIGYVHPTESMGSWGIGLVQLYSGEIEKTDYLNKPIGTFWDSHIAGLVSCGYKLFKNIHLGQTLKVINETIDYESTFEIGMDMSILFEPIRQLAIGVNVQNLLFFHAGGTEGSSTVRFPLNLKGGAAWYIMDRKLILAADCDITHGDLAALHLGAEYSPFELVAFRGGYDGGNATVGASFRYKGVTIDYAMLLHHIGLSHRFGVSLKL